MNRLLPKPDVQKMLKCINSGNIPSLKHFNILSHTKKKIIAVLEKNPLGIDLEKFCTAFEEEFGEWLVPSVFGFSDLVEMLESLNDIVKIRFRGSNDQMLLFPTSSDNKDNIKKSFTITEMREEVINTVRSIITTLGGISTDILISEYEARTNQKLNIQKLGFDSFPHFLSHLSEVFKTCKRDGQVILLDPTTPDIGTLPSTPGQINSTTEEMNRGFDPSTTRNLRKLLEEEFPYGLQLSEFQAAYEGFYGSSYENLDYEKRGYGSLEALLAANSDIVSLHHHHDIVCVLPCQPLHHLKPEQINLSSMGNVVSPSENYSLVEKLPTGKVQVVVGEVYTPKLFWVMHYGEHHSQMLDKLMDRMLEFYSSPLGDRYKLPDRRVTTHMAVAALYPWDQNFYRAFVLSLEDLTTVKLFFVDYGTVFISKLDHLRLLHRNFFGLPAQAIKCSLHGILPAAGRKNWGHSCSSRFLNLVQNQKLLVEVVSEEMTTIINLLDTSHGKDINIADLLVEEGLGSFTYLQDSNPAKEDVTSSSSLALEMDRGSQIGSTSCSFDPEEVMSQVESAVSQGHLVHGEPVSSLWHPLEVHTNNSTQKQSSKSEGSCPHTRSAASTYENSLLESTQKETWNGDLSDDAKAAGSLHYRLSTSINKSKSVDSSSGKAETVENHSCTFSSLNERGPVSYSNSNTPALENQQHWSSTPIKEKPPMGWSPTFSNEIFISDDEFHEDYEAEYRPSLLTHFVEVSFNKRIHVLLINGIQYVLDVDLPYMKNSLCSLGVILNKEIHKDIYDFLIDNECDIFDHSGEVRPTLILYPLTHISAVLARNGYNISTRLHPRTENLQNCSHKHHSSEVYRAWEDFKRVAIFDTGSNSSTTGSSSIRSFYRHGAQVEPLRKPYNVKELGQWGILKEVMEHTRYQ